MSITHANEKDRKRFWYQMEREGSRRWKTPCEPDSKGGSSAPPQGECRRVVMRLATAGERESIYRLRHDIYARELGQHGTRSDGRLTDALDDFNIYLAAFDGKDILGFVSVTPPGHGRYSVDKYFKRDQLPFPADEKLHEIRILTIPAKFRRCKLAILLMYAAFRWIESHGGSRIVAMGRREVLGMYHRVGLKDVGPVVQAGAVQYHLLQATLGDIHDSLDGLNEMLHRIEAEVDWQLSFPYRTPSECFHGGAFFSAIGEEFDALERREGVINADVLDAWFPPSPKVLASLEAHLPWLLRTSPPTRCEGLVRAIARARGTPPECVLPGAGSSDLIFLALRHWLKPESRVLILDPTYGEYAHVLESVIGCRVERLALHRSEDYQVDPARLAERLAECYDLVVLVNPNSPTGRHFPREELIAVLRHAPPATRVWVDETYVEYAGPGQSLEAFAAVSENVIVCKSMSKVYALSGSRVAYLCASPHQLESLRPITPPWAVSLPSQVAAVKALQDPAYYAARYEETHRLRRELAEALRPLGVEIVPSVTNFLLCHLPAAGPDAATVSGRCREQGVFLRDARLMGSRMGSHALRVAVKESALNQRLMKVLGKALM